MRSISGLIQYLSVRSKIKLYNIIPLSCGALHLQDRWLGRLNHAHVDKLMHSQSGVKLGQNLGDTKLQVLLPLRGVRGWTGQFNSRQDEGLLSAKRKEKYTSNKYLN